jgi:hypothetical protein
MTEMMAFGLLYVGKKTATFMRMEITLELKRRLGYSNSLNPKEV